MAADVVAFQHRPQEAPALQWDFRLNDENCNIELTVQDAVTGHVVATLEYTLTTKPEDFDLDRLRAAWARWRGSSPAVS